MTPLEMAQKYYPKLWDINRIKALTAAGKLTADQYKQITGEDYTAPTTT
jgi:hypothetical protein